MVNIISAPVRLGRWLYSAPRALKNAGYFIGGASTVAPYMGRHAIVETLGRLVGAEITHIAGISPTTACALLALVPAVMTVGLPIYVFLTAVRGEGNEAKAQAQDSPRPQSAPNRPHDRPHVEQKRQSPVEQKKTVPLDLKGLKKLMDRLNSILNVEGDIGEKRVDQAIDIIKSNYTRLPVEIKNVLESKNLDFSELDMINKYKIILTFMRVVGEMIERITQATTAEQQRDVADIRRKTRDIRRTIELRTKDIQALLVEDEIVPSE